MPKRKLNPWLGEKKQETGKVGRPERLRNLKYGTTQEQLKKMGKLKNCPWCECLGPLLLTGDKGWKRTKFKCDECGYTRIFVIKEKKK